ncbi:MAG: Gfo/Idh/MocA family oxidoreductase [Lentisphaerae bacterium]|nr:Gfo/Idh/MocA family oxidoreductase [Lentisphaerota bacterium]
MKKRPSKAIRVGVIGVGRGMSFANSAKYVGMELVALCDFWKEKLREAGKRFPGIGTYTDYDRFLEHDMDAVVLANYFHEHAPFAVKALKRGLHVMSETSACKTLAEGVALVHAVELSKKIYLLAENYCYFAYNQEMRRLYRSGEIGEFQMGECEYMHPMLARAVAAISPGSNHWRNFIPTIYYCTHALAPIMYITETRPEYVNAQSVPYSPADEQRHWTKRTDIGFHMLCHMSNGAVTIVNGICYRGHGNWYRLHGTRGLMENLRTQGCQGKLRLVHEPWDLRKGDAAEKIYTPDFPAHADQARRAGHGGGDFFTNYFFAEAIRSGRQPFLNVYRALDMTIAGIQGWRSCLEKGAPMEIPDFRRESIRRKYENDHWSPFPEDAGPGQPPQSILGFIKPTRRQFRLSRAVWRKIGYRGR